MCRVIDAFTYGTTWRIACPPEVVPGTADLADLRKHLPLLGERVGVDLWAHAGPKDQAIRKAVDYLSS